jgi:insertion element IS1 protein InsB
MRCPKCESSRYKKNGLRRRKQSYKCKDCGYQFVENPISRGYPPKVKQICLKMYLNGMGFRAIARVTEIDHTTIINWVKEAGATLSDRTENEEDEIPEITEIDGAGHAEVTSAYAPHELQTFVGSKKHKFWIWTVVNHWKKGILLWTLGDRSAQSFEQIWQSIKCWHSFWYVTDGYLVYPSYIEPEAHLVCKTYMTRVEGENTRLRHYLARLHRKTLCYSKSVHMLKHSIRLLLHYLKFKTVPDLT